MARYPGLSANGRARIAAAVGYPVQPGAGLRGYKY